MSKKPVIHLVPFLSLITGVLGVTGLQSTGEQDFRSMAVISLAISASCVVLIASRWGTDITSGPLLYLVLFLLFHLGLIWTSGLVGEESVMNVSPTAYAWIRTPYIQPAVTLACGAALAFSATAAFLAPGDRLLFPTILNPTQDISAKRLARAGICLQIGGLTLLLITVLQSGGLGIIVGGYLSFLESAQSGGFAYGIWALGVGSCLSQLGTIMHRRMGLAVFLAFAVVLFPLGLRGSVLFPAVTLLATRAITGRRTRAIYLAAGGLAVLSLASIVRNTRVGGAVPAGDTWYSGALSTITELGFSLRPTIEVLHWADAGQSPTWFISFVAVPLRLFEKLSDWNGGPPDLDERLFNVKVNVLAGPIGGSPVAEAFDAAGVFGVFLVMVILAGAIAYCSRQVRTRAVHYALFPVVLLPLLIAVRNGFAPVLPQIIVGAIVVFVLGRTRESSERHDLAKSPTARAR